MPDSTVRIIGDDVILPAGGLVDGVDVSVAVPAAQAAADAAQADATAALADAATALAAANEADDTADAAQATANAAAPAARTISTTAPLSGGGNLSADRTLAVAAVSNTSSGVAPQHAGAGDVGKSLVATATGSQWADATLKFDESWGNQGAPGIAAGRWFTRTGANPAATAPFGEYPCRTTGTFTFWLTARVSGTKLTENITFEIYKNGIATGIALTLTPADTVMQASGSLAVAMGDGISVRMLQAGTETQTNWHGNVNVSAV